jgi:hypothetical protein
VPIELIKLCTWLLDEEVKPLANIVIVTQADKSMIVESLKIIEEDYHYFVKDARLRRFTATPGIESSSSTGTKKEGLITTEADYKSLQSFLSFCKEFLQKEASTPLCTLALSYLVKPESQGLPKNQGKVAALFAQFLELDEEKALNLYKDYQSFLNFPATTALVNQRKQRRDRKVVADEDQWNVVQYLCAMTTPNKPDDAAVSQALRWAAQKGQWNVVQYLCAMTTDNKPDKAAVSQALKLAAEKDQWNVVQYLCTMTTDNKPDKAAVSLALRLAAYEEGNLDVVQYLCTMTTPNKPDDAAVSRALKLAADGGQWNVVQYLCTMTTDNKPDGATVSQALKLAAEKDQWNVVQYLCTMTTDNKPDKAAVSQALRRAASEKGNLDVVQYLCTMTTPNKPDDAAVSIALKLAADEDQWNVVQYLCTMTTDNKPDGAAVSEALHWAAYNGKLDVVQYLCTMTAPNKPDDAAVSQALKLAAEEDQWNVVQYLCTMTTPNKPDDAAVSKALHWAAMANQRNVVLLLCDLVNLGPDLSKAPRDYHVWHSLMRGDNKPSNENVKDFNCRQAKILKLIDSIHDHRKYGNGLLKEDIESGNKAVNHADNLLRIAIKYTAMSFLNINNDDSTATCTVKEIKEEFKRTLDEGFKDMGNHRKKWKLTLANIGIAASGVGLLINFFVTGSAFFKQTERQNKVKKIERRFEESVKVCK